MKRALALEVAGTQLLLLAEKAAYWPDEEMLLVADAHFGKAAAYRALGQPVPHGTTRANLQRLDTLLERYPVRTMAFLGDFLHARLSRTEAILDALADWRARYPQLRCLLVRGNHDARAGDPPPELDFVIVDEPYLLGPFALRHDPAAHATHHVLAGHLHPAYRLQGQGRQSLRLPCFHSSAHVTVLPAFGDFTGGMDVPVRAGDRVFVVHSEGVWQVNTP